MNLVVDGGLGVIWKWLGGVLASYWGVPSDQGVVRGRAGRRHRRSLLGLDEQVLTFESVLGVENGERLADQVFPVLVVEIGVWRIWSSSTPVMLWLASRVDRSKTVLDSLDNQLCGTIRLPSCAIYQLCSRHRC